jgi:hypothetical protein
MGAKVEEEAGDGLPLRIAGGANAEIQGAVELSELGSAAVSYPNFQADLARAGNPCRVAS